VRGGGGGEGTYNMIYKTVLSLVRPSPPPQQPPAATSVKRARKQ